MYDLKKNSKLQDIKDNVLVPILAIVTLPISLPFLVLIPVVAHFSDPILQQYWEFKDTFCQKKTAIEPNSLIDSKYPKGWLD